MANATNTADQGMIAISNIFAQLVQKASNDMTAKAQELSAEEALTPEQMVQLQALAGQFDIITSALSGSLKDLIDALQSVTQRF